MLPNRGENAPTRHLVPQLKPPVPGMSYILSSHWPKRPHENSKMPQTTAKAICYSPRPDARSLLLKTTLTHAIKHGKLSECPTRSFPLSTSVQGTQRNSSHYKKEKIVIVYNICRTLWSATRICLQDILVLWCHKCYGSKNPLYFLIGFQAPSMR